MDYALTIKIGENSEIKILGVEKVDFKIFPNNKDIDEWSEDLSNTIKIEGNVSESNCKQLKEILEWSKNSKGNYGTIFLKITKMVDENKKTIRDYCITNMFCVGYQEVFEKDNDKFILEMKLKDGSMENMSVE